MDDLPFWLLTVAYAAHIMEEYFLDWKSWAERMSKLQMSWSEFFVANAAVLVLGFSSANVGFTCPLFAYTFVGLAVVNALFAHIGTTLVKRVFSPGLITSVFLFLPLSVWAYQVAYEKGILTIQFLLQTLLGGMIVMLFPVLLQLLKKKLTNRTAN